jgi:hypothetical protein
VLIIERIGCKGLKPSGMEPRVKFKVYGLKFGNLSVVRGQLSVVIKISYNGLRTTDY